MSAANLTPLSEAADNLFWSIGPSGEHIPPNDQPHMPTSWPDGRLTWAAGVSSDRYYEAQKAGADARAKYEALDVDDPAYAAAMAKLDAEEGDFLRALADEDILGRLERKEREGRAEKLILDVMEGRVTIRVNGKVMGVKEVEELVARTGKLRIVGVYGKVLDCKSEPDPTKFNDPRLMSHAALRAQRDATPTPEIVEGLIPERSVNIVVGDSGLGKTPLVVQMGVCVALGEPFLGQKTVQSRVMIVDYESAGGIADTVDQICEHLGKPRGFEMDPEWFRIVTVEQSDALELANMFGAKFVIVDALRGFDSAAESKNEQAGKLITTLQLHGAAFLLMHHVRKDAAEKRDRKTPLLQEDRVLTWLEAAAGARALINQTFTRIAVDHIKDNDAALVVRGFYKGRGEFGPWKLARNYGDDGEPIGYDRLMGVELLDYFDKAFFEQMPKDTPMSYGDVSKALGDDKNKVLRFLDTCFNAQVVMSIGKPRSRARKYIFLSGESNFIRNTEVAKPTPELEEAKPKRTTPDLAGLRVRLKD
jgi:hypothetical protein